jgi:hypothetical protein
MSDIDLDRITHPLRLAKGSHQPGSGKGCAMNVISYINGDVEITDVPECSAPALARIVQDVNDYLADIRGDEGYNLSPEDSVIALNLAWQTVGTADTLAEAQFVEWVSELAGSPMVAGKYWYWRKTLDDLADGYQVEKSERNGLAANIACSVSGPDRVEFAWWAIRRWREIAGLDAPAQISEAAVDSALQRIG